MYRPHAKTRNGFGGKIFNVENCKKKKIRCVSFTVRSYGPTCFGKELLNEYLVMDLICTPGSRYMIRHVRYQKKKKNGHWLMQR